MLKGGVTPHFNIARPPAHLTNIKREIGSERKGERRAIALFNSVEFISLTFFRAEIMKSKLIALLLGLGLATTLNGCFGGGEANDEEGGDTVVPTAPGAEDSEAEEEEEENENEEEEEGGED